MSRKNLLLLIAAGAALLFERFGFYAVRGLLMLMMVKQMHLPQEEGSLIYAQFTEQVFLMVFAGAVAVLVLGARITTLLGAAIAVAGVALLVPVDPSMLSAALFLLALGSGLFKVGLYASAGGALGRSAGVTAVGVMLLFYANINMGAFFAPLVAGTAAQLVGTYSLPVSLGLAGMVMALAAFGVGAFASSEVREPLRFDRPRGLFGALLYLPAMLVVYVLMELVVGRLQGLAAGTRLEGSWAFINPIVVTLVGLVAGIVFLVMGRPRRALRVEWIFAAGMLMFAASALVSLEPGAALPAPQRVLVAVVLGAAGEVILSGAAIARLAAGTSPRLAALALAAFFYVTSVSNSISRTLDQLRDTSTGTWGFAGAVALFGVLAVALSGVFQRRVYAESAASHPAAVDVGPTTA